MLFKSSKVHLYFTCSSKKFSNISQLKGFYSKVSFDELPRSRWKSPKSYEIEFISRCLSDGNPENYLRMLMVRSLNDFVHKFLFAWYIYHILFNIKLDLYFQNDVFEYNNFNRMGYLLDKIVSGGHKAAKYAYTIFNLLSNEKVHRRAGLKSLVSMWNEKNGVENILKNRAYLCAKINKFNHMMLHSTVDTHHYCCRHLLPKYEDKCNIQCDKCKADFEIECFNNQAMFKAVVSNE